MHYIILHFTYLLLDFMVQGKINRGRHTDHPAGHHSIQTKSSHALGLNALTVQASTMELGKLFQIHTYRHNHFNGPFSCTTQVSRCQKKSSSGLCGAREDNRGR